MYVAEVLRLRCNLAGLPGISHACGLSRGGLPLGLPLVGRALDEATLIRAAAAYERQAGPPRRPPEENLA